MSKVELKQYPSGFLGSKDTAKTNADKLQDINSAFSQMLNRAPNAHKSTHTSNVECNAIWDSIIKNEPDISSFKFKERIIACALDAFGADTFSTWLSAQSSNPEFTDYHHNFIDETILFITTGERRKINFNSWCVLLNSNRVDHKTVKYTPVQQQWLVKKNELNEFGTTNLSTTIRDFIHAWVKQAGGVDDLAASLFVLFGLR